MTVRVPIKFGFWGWLLRLLLVPQRWSYVEVRPHEVHVQMSWAFAIRIPRTLVTRAEPRRWVISVGVHGWRGRWIVNGASRPIAALVLAEPVRARVLGFPVYVHELRVSVDDVGALERALVT